MKAPTRIYVDNPNQDFWYRTKNENSIEYTRTDAFIEKACKFLKSYRQDTPDGIGYIAGIINDKTIENFKNYMKGE